MNRYRTVPYLNFSPEIEEIHSINGANFIISRDILQSLGGFDERLGPGASGTSEDVELSQRIQRAGYRIGYMRDATVYHSVERRRLTEEYFASVHSSGPQPLCDEAAQYRPYSFQSGRRIVSIRSLFAHRPGAKALSK